MQIDILERLKATTKINGAYPRDIEDAIIEIESTREKYYYWKGLYERERDLYDKLSKRKEGCQCS